MYILSPRHAQALQFQFAMLSGGLKAHVGKPLVYMRHLLEFTIVFSIELTHLSSESLSIDSVNFLKYCTP